MSNNGEISLKITEEQGLVRTDWPLTRGVPFPQGDLTDLGHLSLATPEGQIVPAQFRALSHWPDTSIKWVLTDFQANVPAGGEITYTLDCDAAASNPDPAMVLQIDADDERIRALRLLDA